MVYEYVWSDDTCVVFVWKEAIIIIVTIEAVSVLSNE